MSTKCQECETATARKRDPREPPMDDGEEVLCGGCFENAVHERIDDLESEITALRAEIAR